MSMQHNSYLLLASLLLMIVMSPLLESFVLGQRVLDVIFCLVLVSAVLSLTVRPTVQLAAIAAALAILLVRLTGALDFGDVWYLAGYVLSLFLLVLAFISLMKAIIVAHYIDLKIITDAVSCYLLIGIAWALIFSIIHTVLPHALDFGKPGESEKWSSYIYLSFMTLTTLGYGDITSSNAVVQIWSILEAIVGVLFQAILIARLVSLYGTRTK